MKKSIRELSDAELTAACMPGVLERGEPKFRESPRRFFRYWLLVSAIVSPTILFFLWWGIACGACAGLVPAVILFGLAIWVSHRSRRKYWRELQWRYAGRPLSDYLPELQDYAHLLADSSDVLLVTSEGFRHADFQIRIVVGAELCLLEERTITPHRLPEAGEEIELRKERGLISASDRPRLVEDILALSRLVEPVDVGPEVIDGNPLAVALWSRGKGIVAIGRCNFLPQIFDDFPDFDVSHPVVRVLKTVFEAESRVRWLE